MVKFSWDPMVYPRESSWFGENGPDGQVLHMEQTSIFKDDKFGLKSLADEGRIEKKEIEGVHLQYKDHHINEIFVPALIR